MENKHCEGCMYHIITEIGNYCVFPKNISYKLVSRWIRANKVKWSIPSALNVNPKGKCGYYQEVYEPTTITIESAGASMSKIREISNRKIIVTKHAKKRMRQRHSNVKDDIKLLASEAISFGNRKEEDPQDKTAVYEYRNIDFVLTYNRKESKGSKQPKIWTLITVT